MRGLKAWILLLVHAAGLIVLCFMLKPDPVRDWPATAIGAAIAAFPFTVALLWSAWRGEKVGRL